MPEIPAEFDDHLGLLARDFARERLVVLCGASGSGKSTALRALLERHPAFAGGAALLLLGPPHDWRAARGPLVAVDEIVSAVDLWPLRRLLAQGKRMLAASHLPPAAYALAAFGYPCAAIRVAPDAAALRRHIQRLGAACSLAAAEDFCTRTGPSYADAQIVLAHGGWQEDFDLAWRAFSRNCSIRRSRARPPLKPSVRQPAATGHSRARAR